MKEKILLQLEKVAEGLVDSLVKNDVERINKAFHEASVAIGVYEKAGLGADDHRYLVIKKKIEELKNHYKGVA